MGGIATGRPDGGARPLLVLLPVAGTSPAAAAWAGTTGERVVVPVPVTVSRPEVGWPELAAADGGRLAGSR